MKAVVRGGDIVEEQTVGGGFYMPQQWSKLLFVRLQLGSQAIKVLTAARNRLSQLLFMQCEELHWPALLLNGCKRSRSSMDRTTHVKVGLRIRPIAMNVLVG